MKLNDGTISNDDYINILNLFSEYNFSENINEFKFEYAFNDEQLIRLKTEFDYKDLICEGNQFKTMTNIMIWVFDNLKGNGMCIPPARFDAMTVLKQTRTNNLYSNCYMYATVLNEIYLSMGFKSRMVRCMPMDLNFNDCHCITEVFCDEYDKWIVFDAANKAYYVDRTMIPLNLFELREAVRNRKTIYVPMMKRDRTNQLIQYWTKNLVRFESYRLSRYGNESEIINQTMLHFQSENFPVSDKKIYYENVDISISHIHTSNPELFWKKPDDIK